jgi:NADPH:quinone reductase-like Zn-dependent oxidoreductase
MAKLFNCEVIATAGNKEKMEKCLQLGADYAVNHRESTWYKKVREITDKQEVDVMSTLAKQFFPKSWAY